MRSSKFWCILSTDALSGELQNSRLCDWEEICHSPNIISIYKRFHHDDDIWNFDWHPNSELGFLKFRDCICYFMNFSCELLWPFFEIWFIPKSGKVLNWLKNYSSLFGLHFIKIFLVVAYNCWFKAQLLFLPQKNGHPAYIPPRDFIDTWHIDWLPRKTAWWL